MAKKSGGRKPWKMTAARKAWYASRKGAPKRKRPAESRLGPKVSKSAKESMQKEQAQHIADLNLKFTRQTNPHSSGSSARFRNRPR